MRVLAFNNYDMEAIERQLEIEEWDAPDQHVWGCHELRLLGHEVDILEFGGESRLRRLGRKLKVLGDLDFQWRVLRRAKEYDVIYCARQPTVALLSLLRRLRVLRTPVVAITYQSPRSKGVLQRLWAKVFVCGIDRTLCLSDVLEQDYRALGVSPHRLGQIRWGVKMRFYGFKPASGQDEPHFVSVGKTYRDFQSLISGFPFDIAKLTILGAGKDIDAEIPPAAEGRLEIRSDWINWQEFVEILPGFDGLVLPISMTESRGNNAIGLTAVTEALASGIPVIATDNPYIGVDMAKEGVGLWVKDQDKSGWRAVLTHLLENPDEMASMRQRARQLAEERVNIDAFAQTLSDALKDVTGKT